MKSFDSNTQYAFFNPALNRLLLSLLLLLLIALQSGCDPSFAPIQNNDQYYSIFGYLNASADTQFVRIEELRDSLFMDAPAHLNVKVTLTDITTGQSTQMHDSLFHYPDGDAHNFYSTMEIHPKETYRLEVKNGNANTSAQVEIPDTFPEPVLKNSSSALTVVEVQDIDRLIEAKAVYYTYLNCRPNSNNCPDHPYVLRSAFAHLRDTVHTNDGAIQVRFDQGTDMQKIEDGYPEGRTFTLVKVNMIVAAGNPDWPDFLNLDEETTAHPDTATNINGGSGLLGGIVSDTVQVYHQ